MAIKKSELYGSLWKSCDELRGGMDASQYKDYVLVFLFVKYVSDKYAGQKDALLDVPKGGSFADMVAAKGDKEIGDKINKIIGKLAEANDLKGVIDVADFNNEDKLGKGKEMVDRLSNLVGIFDNPALDFRGNRAEGDDILGDAYEYLMRHFATESGKSKGQFYTPAEVSRIMAKVIGVGSAKSASQTIHDLACGSGSLLLKAHDEAKSTAGLDLTLYGQEMDNATAALARMNMILHDCPTAEIWKDNVLSSPHFKERDGRLKTFDFMVANPPFSFKAWSTGFNPANDEYHRFEFGIPPAKNGDYAFLLHILTSLKSTGKAAVNLPHGVLFRGGAEADIRKNIVRRGYIKGIIGLPANLFYGTGIPACVIVLDKETAAARKGIFMIDASKGFIKDGNKNRLRAQDIHTIVDAFTRQLEIPRFSRTVPLAEISDPKNDYNLNLPRYTTVPSRRTCRTSTLICAAASLTAISTTSSVTGRCSPASVRSFSKPGIGPATLVSKFRLARSSQLSSPIQNLPPSINR
jgi:type I restriction enzyme M protein